jgi:toxin CptA
MRSNAARGRASSVSSECAAWSALIFIAATLTASWALVHATAYELGLIPVIGGAVFELGALVNGACAFGSVARLAGGDLSYLAMPPAFLLGAILAVDRWRPEPLLMDPTEISIVAILIVLAPFALWRVTTAIKSARRRGAVQSLRQPVWRPAFAVFVIASVNAGARLLVGPWPACFLTWRVTAWAIWSARASRFLLFSAP